MGSLFFSLGLAAALFANVGPRAPRPITTSVPQLEGAYVPALAEGAAPDALHAWGTIFLAWSDCDHLHLTEWDLARGAVVHDTTVTAAACSLVNMVRVGDRLVLALSGDDQVRVLEIGTDGTMLAEGTSGVGDLASVDADADHVVVGQLVEQHPVVTIRSQRLGPPSTAIKVTVLERRTLGVSASKMIRGARLFYTHGMPSFAAHSAALLGDRVIVQVPDDKPRVEALDVRSLERVAQRDLTLSDPGEYQHSMPVSRVGDGVVVDGNLLDKDLRRVGSAPTYSPLGDPVARDPVTKTWLVAGDTSRNGVLAVGDMDYPTVIWSHGRAVAIAQADANGTPPRIRVWNP